MHKEEIQKLQQDVDDLQMAVDISEKMVIHYNNDIEELREVIKAKLDKIRELKNAK